MASLPKTFKAAVLEKANSPFVFKDVELQPPRTGEVLVKVLASGICGTDIGIFTGGFGDVFPLTLGHELVGDVAAVGPGEERWKIGDRVGGGWHGGHDAVCKQCQRGQFNLCKNQAVNGFTRDGGYAEYVTLRTEAVVRVPADVDPAEYAPILCAGVTVFNGIRKLNLTAGELVAIQGLGGLGHLAIQYASKLGYRVVALSSGDKKRDLALELGAHEYIDSSKVDPIKRLQELGGAAAIVSSAPSSKAVSPLTAGLQPGGTVLALAPCGTIEVNSVDLILKNLSVVGFPCGHAVDSEEAIAFTQLHGIKCLVERFPLKDVQSAFDHTNIGDVRFRGVLVLD